MKRLLTTGAAILLAIVLTACGAATYIGPGQSAQPNDRSSSPGAPPSGGADMDAVSAAPAAPSADSSTFTEAPGEADMDAVSAAPAASSADSGTFAEASSAQPSTQTPSPALSSDELEEYILLNLLPGVLEQGESIERVYLLWDRVLVIHLQLYTDETREEQYDPIARARLRAITDAILNPAGDSSISLDPYWDGLSITFPPYGVARFTKEDIIEEQGKDAVIRHFDIDNADLSLILSEDGFIDFFDLYLMLELGLMEEGECHRFSSLEDRHLTTHFYLRPEETYGQDMSVVATHRVQAVLDALLEKHDISPYKNVSTDGCWDRITIIVEGVGEVTVSKENIVEELVNGKIVRHFQLPSDAFS